MSGINANSIFNNVNMYPKHISAHDNESEAYVQALFVKSGLRGEKRRSREAGAESQSPTLGSKNDAKDEESSRRDSETADRCSAAIPRSPRMSRAMSSEVT